LFNPNFPDLLSCQPEPVEVGASKITRYYFYFYMFEKIKKQVFMDVYFFITLTRLRQALADTDVM
jgi:hypothetical protein